MVSKIQISYKKSSELCFDPENPRLVEFNASGFDETKLVNFLWDTMAVEELVMSILAQGFFEHEPLYVLKQDDDSFIVLEGPANSPLQLLPTTSPPEPIPGATTSGSKSPRTTAPSLPRVQMRVELSVPARSR